jgi:copper(I)-binding protein
VRIVNTALRCYVAAAAVTLAAPALASCGFDAPTDQVYTPGVGMNARTGSVDVLHAVIVSDTDGTGTVIAALVNNDQDDADRLVEVAGAGDDQAITVESGDGVELDPAGAYQLADEGEITATGGQIRPGHVVALTFTFERGESVTLDVPVVDRSDEFADVPVPSEAATA